MQQHVDLVPLFIRQFEMCNVRPDERHMDYSLRNCAALLDGRAALQEGQLVLDAAVDHDLSRA